MIDFVIFSFASLRRQMQVGIRQDLGIFLSTEVLLLSTLR
ncbi:hypothetical protein AVDCRST_MAG84-2600 [uncultured Microcoleus sp.]|uniref:Uncharacterized protein n=1 Tax=uncultured Microcoleus sp. TaxID=259945 RepID=A0A6J4M0L6_9CYAN|nr:hypothetical protein AVDCRST_MAG84-2600 [uncultured Microcoleus sp.]